MKLALHGLSTAQHGGPMTITIPTPTITKKDRGFDADFLVGTSDTKRFGEPAEYPVEIHAELDVRHYGRSEIAGRLEYAYVVSLGAYTVETVDRHPTDGEGTYRIQSRSIQIGGNQPANHVRLHVDRDVQRHSAKRAESLLHRFLADLPQLAVENDDVRAILAGERR